MAPRRRNRLAIEEVEPVEEQTESEESVQDTVNQASVEPTAPAAGVEPAEPAAGMEKLVQLLARSLRRVVKPGRKKGESSSRRPPPQRDPWLDQMRNFENLRFKGGHDIVENDQWRGGMEHALESLQVPRGQWVRLAVCHLDGPAQKWWAKLKDGEFKGRSVGNIGWEEFRAAFEKEFFQEEASALLEEEFWGLAQGSNSVEDYAAEFNRLEEFAPPFRSEKMRTRKFVRGMNDVLRGQMLLGECMEMKKVLDRAIQVERELAANSARSARSKAPIVAQPISYRPAYSGGSSGSEKRRRLQSGSYQSGGSGSNSTGSTRESATTRACYVCGQIDHLANRCPSRVQQPPPSHQSHPPKSGPIKCYNCGRIGHMQRECPDPPRPAGEVPRAPSKGRVFNIMAPNAGPSGGDVVEGKQ